VTAPIDAPFPSDAWFSELVLRAVADQAAVKRLGIAELRFGIEIVDAGENTRLFGLVLDGYEVDSVGEVAEAEFAPEVVVSGSIDSWRQMVAAIEQHGGADTAHTLNSLSTFGEPLVVRADDAMGHDKFFRFMGTLQAVFDAAGSPATVLAPS